MKFKSQSQRKAVMSKFAYSYHKNDKILHPKRISSFYKAQNTGYQYGKSNVDKTPISSHEKNDAEKLLKKNFFGGYDLIPSRNYNPDENALINKYYSESKIDGLLYPKYVNK
jgi:hypothetical protein